VDLSEVNSRDVTVCCAFNGVDVRFDGVAPRFVAEIGDEWFGVEDDRFGESLPRPSYVSLVVAGVALPQLLFTGFVRCAFLLEALGCRAPLLVGLPSRIPRRSVTEWMGRTTMSPSSVRTNFTRPGVSIPTLHGTPSGWWLARATIRTPLFQTLSYSYYS